MVHQALQSSIISPFWARLLTISDMGQNPGKYSDVMSILMNKDSKLSDTESTQFAKEMVSKIVARKRLESKSPGLSDSVKTILEHLQHYPNLTGLDQQNESMCEVGRQVL
jgi:hypothetical protein